MARSLQLLHLLQLPIPRFQERMANRGGKLVVLWEGKAGSGGSRRIKIWCAEIDVVRRGEGEIWGKIDWSGTVLTVPNESAIVNCLAATV